MSYGGISKNANKSEEFNPAELATQIESFEFLFASELKPCLAVCQGLGKKLYPWVSIDVVPPPTTYSYNNNNFSPIKFEIICEFLIYAVAIFFSSNI